MSRGGAEKDKREARRLLLLFSVKCGLGTLEGRRALLIPSALWSRLLLSDSKSPTPSSLAPGIHTPMTNHGFLKISMIFFFIFFFTQRLITAIKHRTIFSDVMGHALFTELT